MYLVIYNILKDKHQQNNIQKQKNKQQQNNDQQKQTNNGWMSWHVNYRPNCGHGALDYAI